MFGVTSVCQGSSLLDPAETQIERVLSNSFYDHSFAKFCIDEQSDDEHVRDIDV